jgi:hypothetical protein
MLAYTKHRQYFLGLCVDAYQRSIFVADLTIKRSKRQKQMVVIPFVRLGQQKLKPDR